MTDTASPAASPRPPIAAGWVLWLTWIYVGLFGVGVLLALASIIGGRDVLGTLFSVSTPGPDNVNLIWVLRQLPYVAFAIGCVGVLLRDRDFAWVAVVAAWVIVVVQCADAFVQIFHLHLSIPISAFIFGAYAWKMASVLRPRPVSTPPRPGGML